MLNGASCIHKGTVMKIRVVDRSGKVFEFDSNQVCISALFEQDEINSLSKMRTCSCRTFHSVPESATTDQVILAADFKEYPTNASHRKWAHANFRQTGEH